MGLTCDYVSVTISTSILYRKFDFGCLPRPSLRSCAPGSYILCHASYEIGEQNAYLSVSTDEAVAAVDMSWAVFEDVGRKVNLGGMYDYLPVAV